MDLPVISTPLLPRWIWMEEVTYSHIPIATIITAFLLLAPIFEYIGRRLKDFLFFFYYLPWDRMMDRKRLHIFFGAVTAVFGLLIQAVWDALGSYMMTPSVALPGVNEAVGWSAKAFFNPSYPFLFLHRFFGNISYTMLLVGGVLALKFMRAKDKGEKKYFAFASDFTFSLGFLAFFAMPFIGWGYAKVLKTNAPVAFHAIMGGHTAKMFSIKMVLILFFVGIAATYLFTRHRTKLFLLGAVSLALGSLYIVLHLHPPIKKAGKSSHLANDLHHSAHGLYGDRKAGGYGR